GSSGQIQLVAAPIAKPSQQGDRRAGSHPLLRSGWGTRTGAIYTREEARAARDSGALQRLSEQVLYDSNFPFGSGRSGGPGAVRAGDRARSACAIVDEDKGVLRVPVAVGL